MLSVPWAPGPPLTLSPTCYGEQLGICHFYFHGPGGGGVKGRVPLVSVTVPWPAARGSVPSPHPLLCLSCPEDWISTAIGP